MVRTKTGIQGLDKALNGGFPDGNIVLLSGGAGTGKSTLVMQFLLNGASLFGERGLYISTEQTREELHRAADKFGWNLKDLEDKSLIKIIYFDITGGDDFLNRVDAMVEEFKPKRIVIDSMTTLTDSLMISGIGEKEAFSMVQVAESVNPIPRTEQVIAKSILYRLIKELKKFKVTTLLTSELPEEVKQLSADGVTEFIADGVVVLHFLGVGSAEFRSMQIRKMRYSWHKRDHVLYDITGKGVEIKEEEELKI
jgi:circadian clock protein KaiC